MGTVGFVQRIEVLDEWEPWKGHRYRLINYGAGPDWLEETHPLPEQEVPYGSQLEMEWRRVASNEYLGVLGARVLSLKAEIEAQRCPEVEVKE